MPHIVTLTANPAIDISTSTLAVEPTRKLRCRLERRDPGGGGINLARVAHRLGAEVTAIYPAGGSVGRRLTGLLADEGVPGVAVPISGETREDFNVEEEVTGQQFRFTLPGPRLHEHEWEQCLRALQDVRPHPDFICASGSLPPGAPDDLYARAADVAVGLGARFVLDTSGPALTQALTKDVYLVKPNLVELQQLTGEPLQDQQAQLHACRTLIARGRVHMVALTLGDQGALLVTADRALRASALPVTAASTIGAGDSFLGTMVWALASGAALEEALRFGIAGGAAALTQPGTKLCEAVDVHRLVKAASVEEPVVSSTSGP